MMTNPTVAILAGGFGTRLGALTHGLPKPMIDIGGRPYLERVVESFARCGLRDIVMLTGYRAEVVENHFDDGKRFGVRILYSRETDPLGTGGAIREALVSVELEGRFQVLAGRPTTVLDVAHNPQAARILAAALSDMGFHPETHAVFGMLGDKDIRGVIDAVKQRIDRWHVATLPGPRGAPAASLVEQLARDAVSEADRIVVFGSFLTVAAALSAPRSTAILAQRPPHG